MSNLITVVGTIATEPKPIKTQSGVDLCTFRIASGDRRFDKAQQKWVDGETNWFGITAFRTLAEHSLQSFRKGERVIVMGRLRVRRWENEEKSGQSVDVEADAIGHDVRWGVSRFEKRARIEDSSGQAPTTQDPSSLGITDGITQVGWATTDAAPTSEGHDEEDQSSDAMSEDGFVPVAA